MAGEWLPCPFSSRGLANGEGTWKEGAENNPETNALHQLLQAVVMRASDKNHLGRPLSQYQHAE